MKRPFTILALILCITGFLLCPLPSFADEEGASWIADTSWFNYLEPKSEYTISTESQLRGLASLVNEEQYLWKPNRNESFEGVTFILTRDLDLTGSWTPIGVDEQITFSGTFDGQGHTISGIRVESEDPYSGFFGHLSGTVKNLHLEGTVSASADYCGGVAGYLGADAVIRNCQTDVQVAGRNEVGGIAGYVKSGTVYGCINYGEVIGASMTGGVAGECRGGKIGKCGNRGLIVSNGAGSFNNGTGGIAGRSVSASALNMCYNTGDIISSNEATGGIAGYTNSAGSSSAQGTLQVTYPPAITQQPLDAAAAIGETVSFTAGAASAYRSGGGVAYSKTFAWQVDGETVQEQTQTGEQNSYQMTIDSEDDFTKTVLCVVTSNGQSVETDEAHIHPVYGVARRPAYRMIAFTYDEGAAAARELAYYDGTGKEDFT